MDVDGDIEAVSFLISTHSVCTTHLDLCDFSLLILALTVCLQTLHLAIVLEPSSII